MGHQRERRRPLARQILPRFIRVLHPTTREIKRLKPGKFLKQFWLLSQRNLELLKNDRGALILALKTLPVMRTGLCGMCSSSAS